MANPQEKLADALEALFALQEQGVVAIRSAQLKRAHRERLLRNGFIKEVIKGWYISSAPDDAPGDSTAWYAGFWRFCAAYLNHIKGDDWCLAPEQSIAIHTGDMTVPRRLLVRSSKAHNRPVELPYGTSILDIRSKMPPPNQIALHVGLRIYNLSLALVSCTEAAFIHQPTTMRAALSMITDASEVLVHLLGGNHSVIAGRLAGAFRNIGRDKIADDILKSMRAVGYDVREKDPFAKEKN